MKLHPTLQAVVAVCALALTPGAQAEEEVTRKSKTKVSANGLYAVRLSQVGKTSCRLEVLKDDQPSWHLDACVGTVDDLYFVNDDGSKVWVVRTVPEKGTVPSRASRTKLKYPAWTYTEVVALYDQTGRKLESKQLHDFVKSRNGLDDIRELQRHFKWLEGVAGVPGKSPRLNDAGQVELDTIERKTFKLKF